MILWMGGVVDEDLLLTRPAISPAANRWQRGLLDALRALDQEVLLVNTMPEPRWPRGPMLVRGPASVDGLDSIRVPYINISSLRTLSQALVAGKIIGATMNKHTPAALLTYNAPMQHCWVGAYGQRRYGLPWIPIIADVPASGRWQHKVGLRLATACVHLSWSSHQRSTRPSLHLDGGVAPRTPPDFPAVEPRTLLFAGSMNRYTGADTLLEAFSLVKDPAARLWICGKGDSAAMRRAARGDSRVSILGMLPESELQRRCHQASAFVNPRPTMEENEHNFPSKVLEYLSYGKPVISTWTAGLAPEYREILQVTRSDSPADLASQISATLAFGPKQLAEIRERTAQFLQRKRWSVQAGRLLDFVESTVNGAPGSRSVA